MVTNSCVYLVKQGSGVLEIRRIEPLGEPAIDGRKKVVSINVPSLLTPEPREPHGGAQLERSGALLARHLYRLLEADHALLPASCSEQQIAAHAQCARLPEEFAAAPDDLERLWKSGVLTVRGDLLLAAGHQEEGENCLQQALEVAREQGARSLELRAAMRLARLWYNQGRRDEARDLLAPVYGWFTEGFDTLDLKEAKALLEELA